MSNRPLFEKVTIVGVGLIGGSIGLAIRKRKLAKLVMGVVRQRSTVAKAFRRNALHGATMSLEEGVKGADLVILCAPVSTIIQQIKQLKKFLSPETLVIDVASSKVLVDLAAKKYLKGVRFTGCHPMAGGAKSGIMHSDPDLFEKALCFMTHREPAIDHFWRALGCRTHVLTPEKHDEWVARVSHLPHVLAFALFQSGGAQRLTRLGMEATNPSIRDLARLSKSDPILWADILQSNKAEILRALTEHEASLRTLRKALNSRDGRLLEKFIGSANSNSHKLAPNVR